MQSVESKADDSAVRRTLLATGLGAAFGFQGWRLALIFSIPWYGAAWIWLGHIFLGLSVGITAILGAWWKRGILLGLAFGIVSAFGALSMGLRFLPYGAGSMIATGVAGVLTALIADAVFPAGQRTPKPKSVLASIRAVGERSRPAFHMQSEIGRRLARKLGLLEDLERERVHRRKPGLGKAAEERIVWSELLELELQDIDERLKQICRETGQSLDNRTRKP